MGIMPIGPLAMLPRARTAGFESEPVPMTRVERSARAQDETYSSANHDGEPQPGSHELGNQAQDYELQEDGQGVESESSEGERSEAESGLTDPSGGAAPWFELPENSSAKISFFA
jgi:hypothetical protein